jgi:hypothetical protein
LFLIKLSTHPYFIWKILCTGRHPFNRINSNQFRKKLILKINYCAYAPAHRSTPASSARAARLSYHRAVAANAPLAATCSAASARACPPRAPRTAQLDPTPSYIARLEPAPTPPFSSLSALVQAVGALLQIPFSTAACPRDGSRAIFLHSASSV